MHKNNTKSSKIVHYFGKCANNSKHINSYTNLCIEGDIVIKKEMIAMLLAGGQGTRLGLDRPKGTLNIGVNRELYLFEQLFRNLMDVTDEAGAYVPMYIMTSNINHKDTVAFLRSIIILAIQKTM